MHSKFITVNIGLFIIGCLLVVFSSTQKPKTISLENYVEPFIEYSLISPYSKIQYDYEPNYPFVSVHPHELRYPFVRLYEKFNSQYSLDFLASKRIAELEKWGNELSTSEWITTLKEFHDYEKKDLERLLNSNKSPQSVDLILYKTHLLSHKNKISELIFQTGKSRAEKSEIAKANDKLFSGHLWELQDVPLLSDIDTIPYSLDQIGHDNQWGIFEISFQTKQNSTLSKLSLDNNVTIPIGSNEASTVKINRVPISNQKEMYLELKDTVVLDTNQWIEHTIKHGKKTQYNYTSPQIQVHKDISYMLSLEYELKKPISFTIEDISLKNDIRKLYEASFINGLSENIFQKFVDFNNSKNGQIQIKIYSDYPLDPGALHNLKVKLKQFEIPIIDLYKIGEPQNKVPYISNSNLHEIKVLQSNQSIDSFIRSELKPFWFIRNHTPIKDGYMLEIIYVPLIVGYVLILSSLLVFLIYNVLKIFQINLTNRIKEATTSIYRIFQTFSLRLSHTKEVRFLLSRVYYFSFVLFLLVFLFVIFLTICYIFGLIGYKDIVLGLLLVFWIMISRLILLKPYINFRISLVLLLLCVFFDLFNFPIVANNFAVVCYIFFITGILSVKLKKSPVNLPFLSTLYYFLKKDYSKKQKKKIITTVLSFVVISGMVFGIFLGLKRLSTRQSMNPIIYKIEPSLIYPSTKVIVYGSRFGWNEKKGYNLMNSYGKVHTDLWTDNKIIFATPLHWKPGYIDFWIEKPISWNGRDEKAISSKRKIKLLKINSTWTKDDDEYFNNLRYLENETLRLNGYQPNP